MRAAPPGAEVTAVRVAAGRIVARADGRGACHAVAAAGGTGHGAGSATQER
ncbi:hypothetical protein [Microtetraspora niveoalba]|uniref:hypothetical protein n=1 Tax=Microtetraspora niveoalba TaxID=46175 RepID=UPI000A5CC907|nr:hypothetical protein [Microtetraspora niveoalba]